VGKFGQPLTAAIAEAEKRLAARGLPAFGTPEARTEEGQRKSFAAAMGLNVDLLDVQGRAQLDMLAVFPEDVDIPVGIINRFWACGGEPDEFAPLDRLTEFFNLALLVTLDLDRRIVRLHDTTRHYLLDEAKKRGSLAGLHRRLVEAIEVLGRHAPDPSADDIVYYYQYLPAHLDAGGLRDAMDVLLLSPEWLNNKLVALGDPLTLIADYQQFGRGATQVIIGRTLQLISSICARDPRQLLPQLIGRLMDFPGVELSSFLTRARKTLRPPTLVPQHPSLTSAGEETARLEGHRRGVNAMVMLPDGRLASGSGDGTIRLWDISSGAETACFEGKRNRKEDDDGRATMPFFSERDRNRERSDNEVHALAVLPDGRLASGSGDGTIRLWDVLSGAVTQFKGHRYGIKALTALPDGRLASCSYGTIRLWDVVSGAKSTELGEYKTWINALAVLPDGRLASASDDGAIRLWDLGSCAETPLLEGLGKTVKVLAVLPDGRLASSGSEGTWLWDVRGGAKPIRLVEDWVHALAPLSESRLAWISSGSLIKVWRPDGSVTTTQLEWTVYPLVTLPDGRLASGGSEGTIRLWDTCSTSATAWRESHRWTSDAGIRALAVLPDGRIAAGSLGRVELWNADSATQIGQLSCGRYYDRADALAILPDGRLAIVLYEGIRLWDPSIGAETGQIDCLAITALVALPDGRLAGLLHTEIRVWDPCSGTPTMSFKRRDVDRGGLAVLPDGRLAAAGRYGIQLWDTRTGATTAWFRTEFAVTALAALPDNRLVAGISDGTISLLDVDSGLTRKLDCDGGSIFNLAVLSNGRFACGAGKEIRLWDAATGHELARFDLDFDMRGLLLLPDGRLLASDMFCHLHWLEILG